MSLSLSKKNWYLAGDGGSEKAEEVSEERAVEVGDAQPVGGQRDSVLGHPRGLG